MSLSEVWAPRAPKPLVRNQIYMHTGINNVYSTSEKVAYVSIKDQSLEELSPVAAVSLYKKNSRKVWSG